jgi:hypothetical protein
MSAYGPVICGVQRVAIEPLDATYLLCSCYFELAAKFWEKNMLTHCDYTGSL